MKKFDILNQAFALFHPDGNIRSFKKVATVEAESAEHALEIVKVSLPLAIVQDHEVPAEPVVDVKRQRALAALAGKNSR